MEKKKVSEHMKQSHVIEWCNEMVWLRKCRELKLIFAIPNGGKRNITTATRLKMEGVKPGVPDLMLPVARHGFHGLFIEMKRDPSLPLEEKQQKWKEDLEEQGYFVTKCGESEDAITVLKSYMELK